MLEIRNVNHVGIRVSEKQTSIDFYALLGFDLLNDVGFEQGHPVIMKHPSGEHEIPITGSFSFGNMSAIFIRDPDRNVIELDAYSEDESEGEGYEQHP